MFEKSPLQQCIHAITTMLLLGSAFWLTLLIQGSFMVRDTAVRQLMVHVGPFNLTQIERLNQGDHEVIHFNFETGLVSYFLCWISFGLLYYGVLMLLQKNVFKRH